MFNENHQWGMIDLRIRALVRRGKATVLSSPYVTVNNGESATIVAGDEVPYVEFININNGIANSNVKFKQAAVRLVVVPHVVGGQFIDLDVKPEVTSVSGSATISGTVTPIFSTRNADTHLTVRDGQQIIIGGLVRTEETETRRGIPILADIPVIGYLFGSTLIEKKKTEILFILRPRIIKPDAGELVLPGRRK
jgi:general secretion pathway protein D